MNHDEILKLYTNTLKLNKPSRVNGKRDLPAAVMYYFLKINKEAYGSEIARWINTHTGNNFSTCPHQIGQLIKRYNSFDFVKRSDKQVSNGGGKGIQRKYAYQYSLDLDLLEVSK